MKVVIDLIEALREEIHNQGDFSLLAMLLKEDASGKLDVLGEKQITRIVLQDETLIFYIDPEPGTVLVEPLVTMLNSMKNEEMMYVVKIAVSQQIFDVVGFGKSDEDKKFVLFIEAR